MEGGAQILLVEDDEAIGASLARVLAAEGREVEWHTSGLPALAAAGARVPDLVLLDLGLPDIDGVELCRRLRTACPDTVIMMLTARAEEIDVVLGLDAGADDYLVKPFRLPELQARLRAHLRHHERRGLVVPTVRAGRLCVDRAARRAWADGEELRLRPKELDLLALLVAEGGHAVTRERIMSEVWDENWFGSTKTLDQHVTWLRQKLQAAGVPDAITTLRGVGYRLEPTA